MPRLDLSWVITTVIAVCALLSPILTAIINNHYQIKLKKLELASLETEARVTYKRNIYESYLKYAGRCVQYSDQESMKMYGEVYFLAFTYSSGSIREQMILVDRAIANADTPTATVELEKLSPLMEQQLQNL
ncbi:hypothetical protein [[Clostridium] symbiosum]|uniref:hypothetical protein n=1 Tax=Clostridium symbiosum TaxID=1512 RepID=UPI0034A0FE7D